MYLQEFSEYEVHKIVTNKLKRRSSPAPDDLPAFLIIQNINYLIKPFAYLIIFSFSSGIFPDQIKLSKVVPIYKKSDKLDIQNYRPVAIGNSFSKFSNMVCWTDCLNF